MATVVCETRAASRRRALSAPTAGVHVVQRSLWLLCFVRTSRRGYRVGLVVRSTLLRASVSQVSHVLEAVDGGECGCGQ